MVITQDGQDGHGLIDINPSECVQFSEAAR
jgi:hypothetical protein